MVTSSADALSENTTIIEADQFPVKTVKLFQNSGAEVTRTFPLSFLRSQDEAQVVEIVHLPASIQSVDVSLTSTSGTATILDHYHTSITNAQKPASRTLRELKTERLRLENEKRLRKQSFAFLTTYMDSLARCKSQGQQEAAQMVTFFDEFVEIGLTRSAAIAELDGKLSDITSKIGEEAERLSKLSSSLPVKVVAVIACNSQVTVEAAELTVTYVVKQVSWKPAYDLHVGMTGNTPSSTVSLDFRCTVTQWTGENWENISLALTTANQVSQLIQLPEPKTIDIGLRPVHAFHSVKVPLPTFGQPQARYRGQPLGIDEGTKRPYECKGPIPPRPQLARSPLPPQRVQIPMVVGAHEEEEEEDILPPPPPPPGVSQLISHESKDPITHIAGGNIFVPSDHAEHHVLVAKLSLRAEFMRVVAPSVDSRIYYTCEVKNTSEYILFPGTVKTYLNDKHVSSIEIHNTELPQTLECPLAVDTSVKVLHSRAPDALPSVATFTGKATTKYTAATVLHNTHAEPIHGTIVRSSIPLPADPRITVVLKEPAGLAEIDEGSVTVKEGCLARWSTTGGRKGKQVGLFEWVCDVDPGTEVLKAVWEVCAPQDLKLLEQVRS